MRRHGDAGFTMVELLVTMVLFSLVAGVMATAVTVAFRRSAQVDARAAVINTVRQALQRTMRDIRGADLLAVSDNSLTLTRKAADGTDHTLTYSLATSGSYAALVVKDQSDNTQRTVAEHLVGTNPVFSVTQPVPGYQPRSPDVDPVTCKVSGTSWYEPDCVGTLTVDLRVQPVEATGRSSCLTGQTCYVDISDTADIRNNVS